MSPEVPGQALLETPGGIGQCQENVGDPPPTLLLANPCGHARGGDRVVLLACSSMGRCYPLLVRLQPVADYPPSGKGVHKSQALKNEQFWGLLTAPFFGVHWPEPNDGQA